ncbi:MAG: hypothetical protein ACU0A5_14815 [Salipiger marinus]|uniref:hypothetical protein n=1 Tax=Salipiger marinus TaxID=555512 RepID=UPI004059C6A4
MQTIESLLALADAYKRAAGVDHDSTVSHRVFRDSKKLTALRKGADISLRRFNDAMRWFELNWPEGSDFPKPMSPLPTAAAE